MSHRIGIFFLLSLIAVPLGLSARAPVPVEAQPVVDKYLDEHRGELVAGHQQVSLRTLSRTYRHPETGQEIQLVGMVHIGQKSYYRNIRKHIENEKNVFFEGVSNVQKKNPKVPLAKLNLMKNVSALYAEFADLMELSVQSKSLVAGPDTWVRVDMDADEFIHKLGDKAEPVFGVFGLVTELFKDMKPITDIKCLFPKGYFRKALKLQMIGQLSGRDKSKESIISVIEDLVLTERNELVNQALKRKFSDKSTKRVTVIYGAKHMEGIGEFVRQKMGFAIVPAKDRWFKVFSADDLAGGKKAQAKQLNQWLMAKIADPINKPELLKDVGRMEKMLEAVGKMQKQMQTDKALTKLNIPAIKQLTEKLAKIDKSQLLILKTMIEGIANAATP